MPGRKEWPADETWTADETRMTDEGGPSRKTGTPVPAATVPAAAMPTAAAAKLRLRRGRNQDGTTDPRLYESSQFLPVIHGIAPARDASPLTTLTHRQNDLFRSSRIKISSAIEPAAANCQAHEREDNVGLLTAAEEAPCGKTKKRE